MPLSCWLFWASGISTATAVRPTPCCPMTSTCTASLPISSRYRPLGYALGGLVAGLSASPCAYVWPWFISAAGFMAHLGNRALFHPCCQLDVSTVRSTLSRHALACLWACVCLWRSPVVAVLGWWCELGLVTYIVAQVYFFHLDGYVW